MREGLALLGMPLRTDAYREEDAMPNPCNDTVSAAQRRLLEAAAAVGASLPLDEERARVRRVAAEAALVSDELIESGHYDLSALVSETGRLLIAAYRDRCDHREVVA